VRSRCCHGAAGASRACPHAPPALPGARLSCYHALAVTPPFAKVLIANRGEIAVRVIRTCREMGVRSVAVFSEADRESLHVLLADEAVLLGPPVAAESYLAIDRIIAAARRTGAEAIHPGYGFLAENAGFAEACAAAGLVFIGPPASAIRAMGDKVAARALAVRLEVPVVPGVERPLGDDAEAVRVAAEVGYPVMIKAALGGGGKGMRLVRAPGELAPALRAARSEAGAAFGDAAVYIERYIEEPRHIEIQVLADGHGGVVHLGERECSIQRRHQKLIEESPSPFVDDGLRYRLGEAARRITAAAGYTNAGTVEFLVDPDRKFYFLEMNTRLQVEHPVTEFVTGRDLVKHQLEIAAGQKLGFGQDDVVRRGWALECRINAEDPYAGFIPSPGRITTLRPASGPWVRDDSGVYSGCTIPRFYDTLMSKLVVWGPDRETAIARMTRALAEHKVVGVQTTISILQHVMRHPDFVAGRLSTHFLDRMMSVDRVEAGGRRRTVALMAAALAAYDRAGKQAPTPASAAPSSWRQAMRSGWRDR
jgi:acetyl-CoA carboxylase biotin carboxylase subunit